MHVMTVLLAGGVEVIADVEMVNGGGVLLKRPYRVVYAAGAGRQGMSVILEMLPLLTTTDAEQIAVLPEHVIAVLVPTAEAQNGYIKRTTGIQLAQ